MEPFALVNMAINALAPEIPALAKGAGTATARALYQTISGAMSKHHEEAVLDEFVQRPTNTNGIKAVLRQLVRHDPTFAADLARAANSAGSTNSVDSPGSRSGTVQTGNIAYGDLTGRDKVVNTSHTTTNARTNNTGGVVLAAVVIVALLLGFFLIKGLTGALGSSGLGGSSTCGDFLASSDTQDKASIMKSLYLAAGKPHLAADPFLIQNTDYYCGNAPNITLSKLASEVRDS